MEELNCKFKKEITDDDDDEVNVLDFISDSPDDSMPVLKNNAISSIENSEHMKSKIQKCENIINKEFKREIDERVDQVELIQGKIHDVQRYIQVLKYVSSASYYQPRDDSKPADTENIEDAIHPCVQKLLPSRKESIKRSSSPENVINVKKKVLEEIQEKKPKLPENAHVVRGIVKVRHRLVIGNVSKWIPPDDREDNATHKWMIYIRGKENDYNLENLIKKVRYFLHESYKPHDVIDVTSSPFHLIRRGWGEFPARVKIFFNSSRNKPIDVIHDLKLDETYCGSQVLGGETVVEVDLFHENITDSIVKEADSISRSKEVGKIAAEHDYCMSEKSGQMPYDNSRPLYQPQQITTQPISSFETNESTVINDWDTSSNIDIQVWYKQNIFNRSSQIMFLSTESCVKWFLNRWPLITRHALSPLYKRVFPYTFSSENEFATSNIGKQRAAEWYRAYQIRNILEELNVRPWSTKQIMLYSRMHGYVSCYGRQYHTISNLKNISSYTALVDSSRDLRQLELNAPDEEIDIVGDEERKTEKEQNPIRRGDRLHMITPLSKYVEATSRQIGVRYDIEEILPGCLMNASTHIVVGALKLFINDLIRKSLANSWSRNSYKNPSSIEVSDVMKTILENPEFDILTNTGLGSKPNLL